MFGQVVIAYLYNAFGKDPNKDPSNTNPFRYAGEYWDWETQTYYLRARHFNPRTGRFTQPDPFWNISNMTSNTAAVLQSGNLFVYTMHNPVRFIDPTGLFSYEYEGTGNCPIFTGQSSATIGITNGHSSISWSFSGGDVYKDISTINAPVPPGASWDICWGTTDIPIGSGPLDLTSLLFPTLEIAVHVWAIVHHPHSEGGEWVAWITRDTAGRYGFSEPNWALGNMVPVPPWDSDAMYPLVRVALIHTHPTPGGSGHFSVVDANAARANEMPNFLVTPYGNVNRIYPGFRILYGETSGRVDENHEHWDMVSRVITDIFRGQRR